MKTLRYILWAVAALSIFVLGLWLFAPWHRAGLYALDTVRLLCARNGIFINYSDFTHDGVFLPVYRIRDFDIESPVAKLAMSNVTVKILPLDSLLRQSVSCRVNFDASEILMIPENKISLEGGGAKLSATRDSIAVSGVDVSGEMQATGDALYDRVNGSILHSSLLLKVPENINMLLSNPMLSRFIESAGEREWRIKHNAPPK